MADGYSLLASLGIAPSLAPPAGRTYNSSGMETDPLAGHPDASGGGLTSASVPPAQGIASAAVPAAPAAPLDDCGRAGVGCGYLNLSPCVAELLCRLQQLVWTYWTQGMQSIHDLLLNGLEGGGFILVMLLGVYLLFRPQIDGAVRTGAKAAVL